VSIVKRVNQLINDGGIIVSQYKSAILIVDDDSTNLEMSAAILESLEIKADKAESGTKAIELCAANHYDVIFMDIEMPKPDGYETTEIIKQMKHSSANAIIVALSATLSSRAKVVKCIQSGMKDCMVKPLDAEDIKIRFEKWNVQ
jgi:CheY-like chemotaxis protein